MKKNKKDNGRFLTLILRHKPETIGLTLNEEGWVKVGDLIKQMNKHGRPFDMEELEEIVATNNKKRFEFDESKTKIRACQGHSVDVDLKFKGITPPEILYHGTAKQNVGPIMKMGLARFTRNHVHLSGDKETAINVGKRHGEPIIFKVLAGEMERDGFIFCQSANGVWLTNHVPAKYLEILH
jgi:putative RNA 2'-phosphotransferase